MYYDLVEFKYLGKYKLELVFENGKRGVVDLKDYVNKGGVFSRFSDREYFKQAYINRELGVLCWPGEVDIAPETLYHQATGEPLPEWMGKETEEHPKEMVKK